ncbi:solute symporter protein [Natrinema sp. J7-2]|uniref:Solute symporter protein n=1 Tax=Natrinema gari JCM 14663 TaxID=1230459 RepID=L9YQQ0_9EURY|nr:solute symporter protein [Natrinema sp. J7-2]ELY75258.1 solute symporter protein [Natrinema gari JCM 14663]
MAGQPGQAHRNTDYLSSEVNLLKPSTPFMRDHLKLVWGTFIAWVLIVWGPVTLTWLAPDLMTRSVPGLGFPLHYFLIAIGAPTGALILSAVYARSRDRLDQKYGIEPATVDSDSGTTDVAATDGGRDQ